MQHLRTYFPALLSCLIFFLAVRLVFPFYQYYIDPDATAYLTLAKRYAAGDFQKAINGYWSPWGIWLTAFFIKGNLAPFSAAILVNAFAASGFLLATHSLFVHFKISRTGLWFLDLTLSLFLVYAVFWQSFDDLWACFFLLLILSIIIRKDFIEKPFLWVLAGFLGALAYLSKAYAFPFFILEITVLGILLRNKTEKRRQRLKMILVSLFVMLIFSFPWIYCLHEKYGIWMTGTAGTLNRSWYLVGHPFWKEGIVHLLPPVYPDSPSHWEDPFMVNGETPQFYSSVKLFFLQIIRLGYNILKMFQSFNELSAFFSISALSAAGIAFYPRLRNYFGEKAFPAAVSFLLFPLGYLAINFQGRYLWYMLPLSMLLGALWIQKTAVQGQLNRISKLALWFVFSVSFLVTPALGLKSMYREGEQQHRQAEMLKRENIRGSFTSNIPYGPQTQEVLRLSYFSGNPYFYLPLSVTRPELLKEMRKYGVRYYFHFHQKGWDDFQLYNEYGTPFREISGGKVEGLKVFEIR